MVRFHQPAICIFNYIQYKDGEALSHPIVCRGKHDHRLNYQINVTHKYIALVVVGF